MYIYDHNSGNSWSIFVIFALLQTGRNVYTYVTKNVHLTKIMYLCYLVIMKHHHWHKHKHASAFAIGQLHHQSATAPSHATHAVDAVAAHRCHKLWFHTHVTEWQTRWHNPLDWGLVSLVASCLMPWSVIQQRVYETRVMTSMSCDSVYCMFDTACSSRWVMTQLTNGKRACVLVVVPVADILNILCDDQFVFSVLDWLYVSHHAWCSV